MEMQVIPPETSRVGSATKDELTEAVKEVRERLLATQLLLGLYKGQYGELTDGLDND